MNADMFLAGTILFFLLIIQLFRVYKADKEYEEERIKYLNQKNADGRYDRSRKTAHNNNPKINKRKETPFKNDLERS